MSPAEAEVEDEAPAYLSPAVATQLAAFQASGRKQLKPIRDAGWGSARWPAPAHRPAEQEFRRGRAVLVKGPVWTASADWLWTNRIGELDRLNPSTHRPALHRRALSFCADGTPRKVRPTLDGRPLIDDAAWLQWEAAFVAEHGGVSLNLAGQAVAPPWRQKPEFVPVGLCVIDFCDHVPRPQRRVCSRCEQWIYRRRTLLREAGVPVTSTDQLRADCAVFLEQQHEDAMLSKKEPSALELLTDKVRDYVDDETQQFGDIEKLMSLVVHSDDLDAEERAVMLARLCRRWWEQLLRPDRVATRKRRTVHWDRGTVGQRMWGARDEPEDNNEPVIVPPRILAGLIDRGLPGRVGSRATTKRWPRSGLVRIRHGHTFTDDPMRFRLAAYPVYLVDGSSTGWCISRIPIPGHRFAKRLWPPGRRGWPAKAKRYPPVSIYVDDEAPTTLWGLPEIDYTEIVWRDLQDRTTSPLYREGHHALVAEKHKHGEHVYTGQHGVLTFVITKG